LWLALPVADDFELNEPDEVLLAEPETVLFLLTEPDDETTDFEAELDTPVDLLLIEPEAVDLVLPDAEEDDFVQLLLAGTDAVCVDEWVETDPETVDFEDQVFDEEAAEDDQVDKEVVVGTQVLLGEDDALLT